MAIDGKKLIRYMESKGYEVLDFNIVGLEGINPDGTTNRDAMNDFNDTVVIVTGEGVVKDVFKATTEPGTHYTNNPLNSRGAARLALKQHINLWQFGVHKAQSPALVQAGYVALKRDSNEDGSREGERETKESGTGINCHTTGNNGTDNRPAKVDRWSAGCVVIQSSKYYFEIFIPLCKASGLKLFNFTLIDGSDFATFD